MLGIEPSRRVLCNPALPFDTPCTQHECGVSLNTVESLEGFLGEVKAGRWDVVLPQLSGLRLPPALLANLNEHVVLECLELREAETALALLRQNTALQAMQKVRRRVREERKGFQFVGGGGGRRKERGGEPFASGLMCTGCACG